MARKSNTTTTAIDKTSYFFAFQCGICHPGGGPTQYDRDNRLYWSGTQFGYAGGVATLPPEARLDGDYGFILPRANGATAAGTPVLATGWQKNGVLEPDCLLCHLTGYSWKNRAATLAGGAGIATNTAGQPLAAFKVAPAIGAGWGTVTVAAAPPFPPTASAVGPVDYGLGVAAGTLAVNASNQLYIPLGRVGATPQENCRGCHSTPDTKKSGRTLHDDTDVHKRNGVGCTSCHPNSGNPVAHQIGKGDAVIGSVRNDLDNTGLSCANCHLEGMAEAPMIAPDPSVAHRSIPSLHFASIGCQGCHIRYLEDDPSLPGMQSPELVIEMTSTGTQVASTWDKYLRTDPLDPARDDAALVAAGGTAYRWYPALRFYKGKLTTVKPLLTAYYGDWITGAGDAAIIRPIPLRMVRRALTGQYAAGAARLASLPMTAGGLDAANPVPFRKADLEMLLEALGNAVDTANPDPAAANDIAVKPVLVRANRVYFLNDAGGLEWFESAVAESHDFSVNHNVVPKRDAANPVLRPGPYGAGGCTDCHSKSSTFFFARQLVEPAQYEFLDEHGTVANPAAGAPLYAPHWEAMGLTEARVAALTGARVPVIVRLLGGGSSSLVTGAGIACEPAGGTCETTVAENGTLVLTASPGAGLDVASWAGCTAVSPDRRTCSVAVGSASDGLGNTQVVAVTFGAPQATPAPTTSGIVLSVVGTGWGNVSGPGLNCNIGTQGACNAELANGTAVTLTATPGPYTRLASWTGCTPIAGNPDQCTTTIAGVGNVTALFSNGTGGGPYSPTQQLIVRVMGGGQNRITGPGIDCQPTAGTCAVDVPTGDAVTLTAVPAGASFLRWEGCTSASGLTCSVTMTAPKVVFGYFSP